jgi:hypothetical protein
VGSAPGGRAAAVCGGEKEGFFFAGFGLIFLQGVYLGIGEKFVLIGK